MELIWDVVNLNWVFPGQRKLQFKKQNIYPLLPPTKSEIFVEQSMYIYIPSFPLLFQGTKKEKAKLDTFPSTI